MAHPIPNAGAALSLFLFVTTGAAWAQPAPAPPATTAATPVEVTADVVNGEVLCRPPKARLPASDLLDFRVLNRADRPIMFVAPDFFRSANVITSSGFVYDVSQGGFLAAPNSNVSVVLRTPAPGEYSYSCFQPGAVPSPKSSGFLVVVPAANR
jgi:hypothetical protein